MALSFKWKIHGKGRGPAQALDPQGFCLVANASAKLQPGPQALGETPVVPSKAEYYETTMILFPFIWYNYK